MEKKQIICLEDIEGNSTDYVLYKSGKFTYLVKNVNEKQIIVDSYHPHEQPMLFSEW